MKALKIVAAATLALCTSTAVMANDDLTNVSALTGEYVASNPGLETVVPSWTRVDHTGDGIKDGYDFHFDVYRIGTKTKLFSTPARYLAVKLGCETQDLIGGDSYDFKRIGNNIVLSVHYEGYCSSGGYNHTSHVYTVNISTAGQTPWVKSFSGQLIGTGIVPDKNGNGTDELSVIIETSTSSKIYNTLYIYDGETGVSAAPLQKYTTEQ